MMKSMDFDCDVPMHRSDIIELVCTLDDMTAEALGFAMERFFDSGALDVYTTAIGMKKSRPGILLTVTCYERDRELMLGLIFKHTSTLGVRENTSRRYSLDRRVETVKTEYGEVRRKVSSGFGVQKEKYEYEDLVRIARERNMSLTEVLSVIEKKCEDR